MYINDKELIDNILKYKEKLFLHKDTLSILNKIKNKVNGNLQTFRSKEIVNLIIEAWVCILQDSVHNLKCCDYREYAHWSQKDYDRQNERDVNNDFTFGLDKLKNYFQGFIDFESVLYGIDGGYRDHVIHVFRVWLLGIVLMYTRESGIELTIQDIQFDTIIKGKSVLIEKEVISMWGIIALCHDLGYPLEKAEKINESVEKMYRHLGKMNIQKFSAAFQLEHQFLNKFILDFISSKLDWNKEDDSFQDELAKSYDKFAKCETSSAELKELFIDKKYYHTSIQSKYYIKFAKSLEYYSHGIISCSILFKALVYFLESDFNIQEQTRLSFEDARQFFIRREILRSIAAHTCPEVYHLKANTLSFLLILCDELQEWGRPRFEEMQTDEGSKEERKIEISRFCKDEIIFLMEYSGIIDPDGFAKKMFRRWHEILRSAVYDSDRTFVLRFDLKINGKVYNFDYTNNKLDSNTENGLLEIYELKQSNK